MRRPRAVVLLPPLLGGRGGGTQHWENAMRKVDALRELQEVDSALDQVRARLARISTQWGKRAALDAALAARDAAVAELRHRQGDQRDLELQIEKLSTKVK